MNKKLLALYGLKYNPFSSEVPVEGLYSHQTLENFCWRIEHVLLTEGGFALVSGEPGTGKSVTLRLIADHLKNIRDVQIGIITHPSAKVRQPDLTEFKMSPIYKLSSNLSPGKAYLFY